MNIEIFKLHFKTPVHFGKKRLSDGEMTILADTLFSALFIESLQLGIDTNWLLNDIVISDTFPFESELYYLPKPLIKIESKDEGNHKDFKKLKYIPVYHYLDYIEGHLHAEDAKDLNEIFNIGHFSLQTKVALINQENNPNADSEPYSVGTFTFEENAGLYFIAKGSNKALEYLKLVMNALQFSGIGGKRFSGLGRFELETTNHEGINKLLSNQGSKHILLSSAMAKDYEIEDACEEARYALKKRSGFIQSINYSDNIVKKNNFYSFAAGSVFINSFEGGIFNVGVDGQHPVYQYAKPLWLEV
ncbi:type III-A CRISPR-associated RAMP protein Csm4 [Staphylococcus schleiferi]|uniref:type III-A CRISPR-associated RAMP protein Csm4 n=1 Tax=Staphylococcus sp. 191 TaxID=2070016 RepID=UPI0013F3A9AE|nr:type III-A CRISPR-associated RAMP protein Csm4 [Staphylococcus sp. 191]NHA35397.1 type III-A CRISPR-associated RAMP protein Csm4 [Staphylococcus schleiferi]NHB71080.1 type III-A CRISPR-associated RAMP protein Csm4 [Staphylococcus sp. 191]